MAFATAGDGASGDVAAWMARYPRQAGEIARFAARQWAQENETTYAVPSDTAQTMRVREIGLSALRAYRAEKTVAVVECAPLASLLDAAAARGLTPALLAARLGLTTPYVAKLQRRMFAFASLPAALIHDLAEALGRGADEISAYLQAGGPQMARGASFSSETRPEAGEASDFGSAVASDKTLSPETRARYGRNSGGDSA